MGQILLSVLVAGVAMMLSSALVPLTRSFGRGLGIMDAPGERKVHQQPTPRTGGWAVFPAFLFTVLGGYLALPLLQSQPALARALREPLDLLRHAPQVEHKLLAVMVGAFIAFGVGFADDVLGARFPVLLKAAGQLTAAGVLVLADVKTSFMPWGWGNVVVTLVWLVGMTNAFNLLDNMDGLCAGVAAVASIVLLVNAWALGEYFISLILLAFIGSLLGFLFFNFHPASVFLGDCGSHFIGFMMGALALLERYVSHAESHLFPVLMPVLVLALPILDTTTVVVIRLREGRPVYVGDSRHLSHQLVAIGFSQREAVMFLYLATLCFGLGAANLADADVFQSAMILLQGICFAGLILGLMFVRARKATAAVEP
jgi:UDP-GlcNAc:undecaprenyl-phosphate/decaprenyl-phosphate GlcNAc-1-phosphate transferase